MMPRIETLSRRFEQVCAMQQRDPDRFKSDSARGQTRNARYCRVLRDLVTRIRGTSIGNEVRRRNGEPTW